MILSSAAISCVLITCLLQVPHTFIDDYSRKTWVYLLKQKSQALDVFKSFKAMAEKESNKFIKFLRLDGGGEYMGTCKKLLPNYDSKKVFALVHTNLCVSSLMELLLCMKLQK